MNPIYPHPRPTAPIHLYLLAGLATCGLAALWLAAFHAFIQVAPGPQAFFAASLIEAGLIVEALALIKRPRTWYIAAAVMVSLAVSGTYNYIQAAAAAPALNWWQLGTLALGPLSALAFVSLTLGHELSEHQERLRAWQADRAGWIEQRRQEAEQRAERQEAERQARIERAQEAERQRQQEAEARRFQAEQAEREWQRKRQERAERKEERKEEPARSENVRAQSQLEPLKCRQCGATAGKSGAPFLSQAALNAHQAHCPSVGGLESIIISTNGNAKHALAPL